MPKFTKNKRWTCPYCNSDAFTETIDWAIYDSEDENTAEYSLHCLKCDNNWIEYYKMVYQGCEVMDAEGHHVAELDSDGTTL